MGNSLDACQKNGACSKDDVVSISDAMEVRQQNPKGGEATVGPPENLISLQKSKGFVFDPKELTKNQESAPGVLSLDKSPGKSSLISPPALDYINEVRELDSNISNRGVLQSSHNPTRNFLEKPISVGSWAGSGPCLTLSTKLVKRKMPTGAEYEGDTDESGQAHGRGKYTSPNGDIYEGEFTSGKMSGTGTMVDSEGNSYSGGWKDGLRCGRGVERSACGDVYEGEFVQDQKCGYGRSLVIAGVFYSSTGFEYAGNFENDVFEGYGTLKSPDSITYVGNWKAGLMHGRGTLRHPNGETFVGEFMNGKKHGNGRLTYKNPQGKTERFEGYWHYGVMKEKL